MPDTRSASTSECISALTEQVSRLLEENAQLKLGYQDFQSQLESFRTAQSSQLETSKLEVPSAVRSPSIDPSVANLITPFSGKTTEDVTIFINDVLAAAGMCNWSDETTLRMANLRLTGEAKTYVMYHETLGKASTFEQLAEGLRQRYRKQNSARFFREKLSGLTQKVGETVETFSDRIRKINAQTYELTQIPEADRVILREAENRALDVFLRGIPPEFSRRVRMENPEDLAAALRVATQLQEIDTVTRVRADKRIFASEKNCYRCGVKGHLKAQCNQPQCYTCGRVGHKADACRIRKQNGGNGKHKSLNGNGNVSPVGKHSP